MNIQMYTAEAVISRRGGKKSGARYAKYAASIAPHLDWLNEQISASKDGAIRIKLADFAEACGLKMQKVGSDGKAIKDATRHSPTSIYWGMKYSLFHMGIVVNSGKIGENQPVLIMRKKVEGDALPASLQDKEDESAVDDVDETDEIDPEATDAGEVDPAITEQN